MAKLSMPVNTQNDPEVAVIAEDITSALAQLAWLLEGRVDYDNLAQIVSGDAETKLSIPASKVQDIPLISNEINCDKFFRNELGTYDDTGISNSFTDLVWEPLKEAAIKNPIFSVFSADLFVPITKDSKVYNNTVIQQDVTYTYDIFPDETKTVNFAVIKFNNTIYVDIPTTYTPIKYSRLMEQYGFDSDYLSELSGGSIKENDYAVSYEIYIDSSGVNTGGKKRMYLGVYETNNAIYNCIKSVVSLEIAPTITGLNDVVFDDEDFINISVKMSVLCEEKI